MYPDDITHVGISVGPKFPVRPERYAGIERDAADLAVGLALQGMRVHVMASGDSRIAEEHPNITLHPIVPVAISKLNLSSTEYYEAETHAFFRTIETIRKLGGRCMDVVDLRWDHPGIVRNINHMDFRYGFPIIASLSCRPDAYVRAVEEYRYQAHNACIHPTALSNAHREALLAVSRGDHYGTRRDIEVMPFGVSFKEAEFSAESLAQSQETPNHPLLCTLKNSGKDYLLHAATINKEKGQASTIALFKEAQKAGLDDAVLVLAGVPNQQSPAAIDYWHTEVEPHINGVDIVYAGELDEAEKWEFMKFARATVFCSGMETPYTEAYGRVLAESAGSGTPVVGIKSDTFKEVIKEGTTGIGFTTIEEGAQKIIDITSLDRTACKDYARSHMSNDRFIAQMGKLCTYMAESRKYFFRGCDDRGAPPNYEVELSLISRGSLEEAQAVYMTTSHERRRVDASSPRIHPTRHSSGNRPHLEPSSIIDHYGLDVSLSAAEAERLVRNCSSTCRGHSFFDEYTIVSG